MRNFAFTKWAICCFVLFSSCESRVESQAVNTILNKPDTKLETLKKNEDTIDAGKNIGPVHLGDSFEKVLTILPLKKNYDFIWESAEYITPKNEFIKCPKTYQWISPDFKEQFFNYFEDDTLIQIEADTEKYKTEQGAKIGATIKEIKKIYPNLEAFVLKNSGEPKVGGKDFVYLVDKAGGIAFEFRFSTSKKKRLVNKIIVFKPDTFFQPQGCPLPLKKLEKITQNVNQY